MRVLFTVSGWQGHYYCMVPLGWALQAAGHEVRVACPPAQTEAISRAGLTPVPVLDGPDVITMGRMTLFIDVLFGKRRTAPLHPFTGEPIRDPRAVDLESEAPYFWEDAAAAVRHSCDGAVEFARWWQPDLVVHDVMAVEGALAAAVQGVPSVYFGPGLFGAVESDPGLDLRPGDPVAAFDDYGVGPWSRDDIQHMIDPSPDSVIPPLGSATRLPVRYVPYNGPGSLPTWAATPSGRRRICVLWGNSATGLFGTEVPALRHAIDAAAAQDAEVLLMAGAAQVDALGPLPPGVRPLRNFPLHLLLDSCDAIVHHGSDNCYLNAAAKGIPQVGLGLSSDQLTYGDRMTATGAALALSGFEASREEIGDAVRRVLTEPAFRTSAERLRAEVAQNPAPADLVGQLVELAETGRPLRTGKAL
ncbi:nucleotide disphospho-sugar-binding domain-containing protein [Kitasatospora sp. NBC_01302]|uniref:nucleotide disphospho-sugar-binding domain-containing protein n=1 Tax=Kitasatospora sp. NBC_01302 TaxID=2903575 RepID=UPI002E0D9DD3|nr:DUF1205 domain-containing protein [Kitasatospora sp. NBC_01302]